MIHDIPQKIEQIRETIHASCEKAGRDPSTVRLVAISKGKSAEEIAAAVHAGVHDIGENYLQEALPKQVALKTLPIRWHFTGHVQRNKAESIARQFELIQGVDSWHLVEAFERIAPAVGKSIPILLQIRVHPNAAHGFTPEELLKCADALRGRSGIEIRGLMTMGYPVKIPLEARPFFKSAREVFEKLKKSFPPTFQELSMGMSDDFDVAIEEGATLIRIGRAIFGSRKE